MLYVTTRSRNDAYTAPRTISSERGTDGGMYLPFRMSTLDRKQVMELGEKSFGQCVAETLNQFFTCRLTGWDVEFCIGRYPAKLVDVSHRVLAAQTWHNQSWDYAWAERTLALRIGANLLPGQQPSNWLRIAIRIAFLTGIFSELIKKGIADPAHPVDVAVPAGDFSVPMSLWYARQMGLPIANIVCGCEEDSGAWELLHQGVVKTEGGLPENLERLICGTLGHEEVSRYNETCQQGGVYSLLPSDAEKLRSGMFAAVVSEERMAGSIPSLYRTSDYILGPVTALGYGALLDYRARTGESRPAVLLAERSPVCDGAFVAQTMNISLAELKEKLK
ncbi:MAG: hypothetical protein E7439_01390 [Ruminococcaceae bacterium]|nr:hypothetical protein [Oscillospiraceae bacterium]